jgi:hypothetical protein
LLLDLELCCVEFDPPLLKPELFSFDVEMFLGHHSSKA